MELNVLRRFPNHEITAEAAAGTIMDRARADPAFSVAFGDWHRKDRVQENLRSLAAERDAMLDGKRQTQSKKNDFWRRRAVWLGATSTAVLVGVLVTVLSTEAQRVVPSSDGASSASSSDAAPSASPRLVVDQVSLGLASAQGTNIRLFEIDIKLLNTGTQIAAINAASLTIQDFAVLRECTSEEGGFVSTGSYRANLPASPIPGQVVNVPISQLVEANGADRFDLLLAAPIPAGTVVLYDDLYRIDLRLSYNVHTAPLDLGEIIVNFPGTPTGGEYYWSKYWAAHSEEFNPVSGNGPAARSCDIRNSLALRVFLLKPAMRTADVAAITNQLAYK
jgi:hypothetical protein